MDLAVVCIAGTTEELWETYAPTFEKMKMKPLKVSAEVKFQLMLKVKP
jgi:hypothetical protein